MEGCCIARYSHHHAHTNSYYNPYDGSKMDRIMLRFRPIAPKPVVGGPTTTSTNNPANVVTKKNDHVRKGKRKTSTAVSRNVNGGAGFDSNPNNVTKRRRKSRSPDGNSKKCDVVSSTGVKVTLPLLPETPDLSPRNSGNNIHVGQTKSEPMWLCFGSSDQNDRTTVDVVSSSVIIEGVTDTWMDGNSLGRTDEERRRRLDDDTCPGFISDAWNRVSWTNKAYRRMVAGDDATWGKEKVVMVKLGMREKVELPPVNLFPAFTCRVKVVYYSKQGMINGHSLTVPCDAWRMDGGGFAWRLDIKAALSLGR